MQVLKPKGAQKFKKFGVKLPISLHEKIAKLTEEVKEKGYQVDFSEPCIEALTQFVKHVEADLKEIPAKT